MRFRHCGLLVAILGLVACGERADESAATNAAESEGAAPVVTQVIGGALISGANGMAVGPDGLLYVASVLGSEIRALDPETGEVKQRWTAADGVDGPDDVAFAPDGAMYWTSILTGEVAGFRPDGTRVTAARLTPGVNPLTFSDDGRLFVSQCFFDDKLYEVDPLGKAEPRLIRGDLGPGCGLNGMDWGTDGRLYGPRWFRGEVVSLDVMSGEMHTVASGFDVPASVKFDPAGRLNVLDTKAGKVIRLEGDTRTALAELEPGLDNFAFDAEGRLFVSSFTDGFVVRFDTDGSRHELLPGGLAHPGGVAVRAGSDGTEVVIADLHAVRSIHAERAEPTSVERNVLGVSELGSSLSVTADGARLILTSWVDGDVRVWDPASRTVVERYPAVGAPVDAGRYFGKLVVSEHASRSVLALEAGTGDATARGDVFAEGLEAPTGLATNGADLFVADRVRGQVLRIASDGKRLDPAEVVAEGLDAPEGLAVHPDGLVVMEAGRGRVTLLGEDGSKRTLAELQVGLPAGSEAQPPSMVFNGVAVAPDGAVYVTGEHERALYRIDLH